MKINLSAIQERVGGELKGDGEILISGVNSLELAESGDIVFAESKKYYQQAEKSRAAALLIPNGFPELKGRNTLRVAHPKQCFIGIMQLFDEGPAVLPGIHPTAVIAEQEVTLGENIAIAEHAVIREKVTIGANTCIESGVHIARDVRIGKNCRIGPNVAIMTRVVIGDGVIIHAGTVIGGEGFGYFWNGERQQKIPQLGGVRIDDQVEIGCNVCIDRATFGVTRIRAGVKIDNLVQIAHNNDIGEHSIIVSHVGLSGSVTLGKRVTLAGQVGVADHITIGDGATAAARTGISKDVQPGQVVWGAPNRPIKQVMKELACMPRLPKLIAQVKELLRRIEALEKRL